MSVGGPGHQQSPATGKKRDKRILLRNPSGNLLDTHRILPLAPTLSPWQQEQAATLIRSVRERLLAEDPDIAADPDP
jgi:hypothetical protein